MKSKYIELCKKEESIPLFSQYWWLDAVCGAANWDVVLVEKGGQIVASMPVAKQRKLRFSWHGQPTLTQTLGPWIKPTNGKYAKRLSNEKKLMEALIDKMPPCDHFVQCWHHSNTNWLPFYWKGFKQSCNYTYILKDLSDMTEIWKGFEDKIKGDIKKAERLDIKVDINGDIDEFLALNEQVFTRQGKSLPYSRDFVKQLDNVCAQRNCRAILIAKDKEGRNHAGAYIIWDGNCAYYLMGGGDPELRNSGATSLVLWESIKFSASVSKSFDFEGSMLEPVERFVRGFGAQQVPYFKVSKTSSKLLKLIMVFRELLQGK